MRPASPFAADGCFHRRSPHTAPPHTTIVTAVIANSRSTSPVTSGGAGAAGGVYREVAPGRRVGHVQRSGQQEQG